MPNPQAQLAVNDCLVGDRWDTTFTIAKTGQDFTTATATAKLRNAASASTTAIFTFTPTVVGGVGSVAVTLSLTGTNTTTLGAGSYLGELIVSVTSPTFGPYTVVQFTFNILSHQVT